MKPAKRSDDEVRTELVGTAAGVSVVTQRGAVIGLELLLSDDEVET